MHANIHYFLFQMLAPVGFLAAFCLRAFNLRLDFFILNVIFFSIGDGGAPLVCPIAGRWYVVGLVAWGIGRLQNYAFYIEMINKIFG